MPEVTSSSYLGFVFFQGKHLDVYGSHIKRSFIWTKTIVLFCLRILHLQMLQVVCTTLHFLAQKIINGTLEIVNNWWNLKITFDLETSGACIIKLITAVIYAFPNKLECLTLNTILGWKGLPGTNSLAYYWNWNYGRNKCYDTGPGSWIFNLYLNAAYV
jgi:hypothetical protein